MKVMVLAAGRGERMRPLTDDIPKPLVKAGGVSLIEHTLIKLRRQGFDDIVVNLAYRGNQIRSHLGDGRQLGLRIRYSDEGGEALETAGGIIKALPLLGDKPFMVVNGDIATDFPFARLRDNPPGENHARLILVPNPDFKTVGDFSLMDNGMISAGNSVDNTYTFSGISVYHPGFFAEYSPGKRALGPILRKNSEKGRVAGEVYRGWWMDIGTPERLETLRQLLE